MTVAATHATGFAPVSEPTARCLVLGSMPGQASLSEQRYYAHPRNGFWPIVCAIFQAGYEGEVRHCDQDEPDSATDVSQSRYRDNCQLLIDNGIALWDVLAECTRPGSLDSRIDKGSVRCNDFALFFDCHPLIEHVLFNGRTAEQMFRRHVLGGLSRELQYYTLPSTSPAMASLTLEQKTERWRCAFVAAGVVD